MEINTVNIAISTFFFLFIVYFLQMFLVGSSIEV